MQHPVVPQTMGQKRMSLKAEPHIRQRRHKTSITRKTVEFF